MLSRLVTAAVLFACAFALRAEQVFYQIDLAPTGKVISQDLPVAKGTTIVFHRYPDGALMSMRRTEVKTLTRITPQAAQATLPKEKLVQIGNLAFQGSSQAGPSAAGAASKTAAQPNGIGQGFYGNVVPGQTQGMPNSPNDNQVGRTWAAPPGNAVQSSAGAPPTNSALTNGQNPPSQ
jgi:hypothetical protein